MGFCCFPLAVSIKSDTFGMQMSGHRQLSIVDIVLKDEVQTAKSSKGLSWSISKHFLFFETEGQHASAKEQEALDHLASFSVK